jgi:NAD(P)-dependent dehydrogenase (short-subunit alcohol dehydrogenase family)
VGVLDDRVAIVTGAGQGLGFGIAKAFADEGAKLMLVELAAERLEARAAELRGQGAQVAAMVGDVQDRAVARDAVARALAEFGQLDILVNNAQALAPPIPFIEQDDEHFDRILRSGLMGTVNFMQAAYPAMKGRGGSIINFSSGAGFIGNPGQAAYGATKEAIRGLSRVVAREWGADQIRINMISPAANSPSFQAWFKDKPVELAAVKATMALGRPSETWDVGALAVFLASPACFLTGQTVQIDGGQIMP